MSNVYDPYNNPLGPPEEEFRYDSSTSHLWGRPSDWDYKIRKVSNGFILIDRLDNEYVFINLEVMLNYLSDEYNLEKVRTP